jgi:hypothetical protein
MAETTVELNGREYTFGTKKEMLKQVGRSILEGADGPMTLRQLYYRFVAADLVENKESQYDYLGEAMKEARLEGLVPWGWLEDRTRSADAGDHEEVDPGDYFEQHLEHFRTCHERYNRPRWEGQDDYVEVWVEKEALAGVFADVCEDLRVVSFPNRGYTSVTLLKEEADRFEAARCSGPGHILYFGDYDPSGQDIERNIREKLNSTFGVSVHVHRVALTREQIDERGLPPQPAKRTDSRYEDFVEEHGDMAVELDALPPEHLQEMVREAVSKHFDEEHYEDVVLPRQRAHRGAIEERVGSALDE